MSLSFPTKTLSGHELSPVPCTGGSLTVKKKKTTIKQNKKSSLLPPSNKIIGNYRTEIKKLLEIPLSSQK